MNNFTPASPFLYKISITGFKDDESLAKVKEVLSRIVVGKTPEDISRLVSSLPFFLMRSANAETTRKLKGVLESRGAILKIEEVAPPESIEKTDPPSLQGSEYDEEKTMILSSSASPTESSSPPFDEWS